MSPRKPEQNEAIRQKTRKKITDAALELFAKEGYASATISSIAKKAGVSKGLIYHYFKSKKEILEAIFNSIIELSRELAPFNQSLPAAEKMKVIIDGSFYFMQNMTDVARLIVSLAIQPDVIYNIKAKWEAEKEKQIKLMTDIFSETGCVDKEPEAEAYFLGAALDGIMLGYLALGEEYPLEEVKQKLIDKYVLS